MSNPFDDLLAEVATLRKEVAESRTHLRLGTVTAALAVLFPGDTTATQVISTVPLTEGDRVLAALHGRRVYVVGVLQ